MGALIIKVGAIITPKLSTQWRMNLDAFFHRYRQALAGLSIALAFGIWVHHEQRRLEPGPRPVLRSDIPPIVLFPALGDSGPLLAGTAASQTKTNDSLAQWRLVGLVQPQGLGGTRDVGRVVVAERANNKQRALRVGETLAEGWVLRETRASKAVFEKNGERAELAFEGALKTEVKNLGALASTPALPTPPLTPVLATAAVTSSQPTCGLSAEQRAQAYFLSSELLVGIQQNTVMLSQIFQPDDGKLRVQNAGGLSGLLGIQDGDAWKSANAAPLQTVSQVLTSVVQAVARGDVVTVLGTRAGAAKSWVLSPAKCK